MQLSFGAVSRLVLLRPNAFETSSPVKCAWFCNVLSKRVAQTYHLNCFGQNISNTVPRIDSTRFDSQQFRRVLFRPSCFPLLIVRSLSCRTSALHPALRPVLRAALSAAFYSALCVALTHVLPCVVLPCCTVFETAGARRGVTQPVVLPVVLGGVGATSAGDAGARRRGRQPPSLLVNFEIC